MKSAFQTRCLILCALLVAALSVLSWRVVWIQLFERQHYAESSRRAFHRIESLPAMRGTIVDRHEEPLAKSIPVSTVFVDKNHLEDPKIAAYCLAYQQASAERGWAGLDAGARRRKIHAVRGEILASEPADTIVAKHLAFAIGALARPLGMRREELRARIEQSRGKWIAIAKDLPEDVADNLRETVDSHWIQGVAFQNSIKRWYTAPNQATHLVGYTGEIEIKNEEGNPEPRIVGRFGIESAMEEFLAGRDGWREHCRDARGLVIPGNSSSLKPPRAGLNVQLTIDMGLQAIVEEELDSGLAEFIAERGAVILMDPHTGDILAMASRPHFDLNRRDTIAENGFNFAIQGRYEPGSTFKIVAVSGAINERLATPFTSIFCHNGTLIEGSVRIPDHRPFGSLTLEGILVKSSNIGAYKVARQLGVNRFFGYVETFGFGRRTGIQLSGEVSGLARNTGNPTDFSRVTYGYALDATPLQIATAYCVIAGDGALRKPRVIKSLIANDGTVVEDFPPEIVHQTIKADTARKLRAALAKVTQTGGTGTRAAVPGYTVGGKTGTARKIRPAGGYYANRYTVSFAGMLPALDPAFVCLVVVDDPRITGINIGGGSVAAPVFQKIATRAAAYLNLTPTEPLPEAVAGTSP